MIKILIVTSIFLVSLHAHSQPQLEGKSHQKVDGKRSLVNFEDHKQNNAKYFLAERYLGKSLLKKFSYHLEIDSRVEAALERHNRSHKIVTISPNDNPARKPIFYIKMVKGEWKTDSKLGVPAAAVYSTRSFFCLIWNEHDTANGRNRCFFSFGDFSIAK